MKKGLFVHLPLTGVVEPVEVSGLFSILSDTCDVKSRNRPRPFLQENVEKVDSSRAIRQNIFNNIM